MRAGSGPDYSDTEDPRPSLAHARGEWSLVTIFFSLAHARGDWSSLTSNAAQLLTSGPCARGVVGICGD